MTVLDRMPVDDITKQAREVDVARLVLALVALIPFLLGWVAGKAVLSLAWLGLAVKAGWADARRPATRDGG